MHARPTTSVDTLRRTFQGLGAGSVSASWGFVRSLALSAAISTSAGCGRSSTVEAMQLVLAYNEAVARAYRQGDVSSAMAVVAPREAQRIDGLIGARAQTGMALDCKLLRLEVIDAGKEDDEFKVRTRESWSYVDRGLNSGRAMGPTNLDSYEMLYVFKRQSGNWLVEEIQFSTPPKIGRTNSIWSGTPTRPMAGETNATTLSIPYSTRLD